MKKDIIIDRLDSLNNSGFNSHFRFLPIHMYLSHSSIVQYAKTVNTLKPSSDFETKIALMENICHKKNKLFRGELLSDEEITDEHVAY